MKRLAFALILLLASTSARAEVFALFAQANLGFSAGSSLGGDQDDTNFFQRTKGFAYGAVVGAQVLFLRFWIDHQEYTNFSDFKGTWTQFMLGGEFGLPLGEVLPVDFGIRFGAGYGIGTGQQAVPPLNNGDVSDRGIVLEVAPAIRYKFASVLALGFELPIAFSFLTKTDAPITTSDKYTSFGVKGLVFLEVSVGL
jgi:hypothetical protein